MSARTTAHAGEPILETFFIFKLPFAVPTPRPNDLEIKAMKSLIEIQENHDIPLYSSFSSPSPSVIRLYQAV